MNEDCEILVRIYLADADLERWLLAGVEMPEPLTLDTFAEFERKRPRDRISIVNRALPRLVRTNIMGFFYGEHCTVHFHRASPKRLFGDLSIRFSVSLGSVECARNLFDHFLERNGVYGRACLSEEDFACHLWGYDLWGDGRLSATYLGACIEKYIPGLYWMNMFSDGYVERHGLDLKAVAGAIGAEWTRRPNGVVLRLYQWPGHWPVHRHRIDALLKDHPRFFSLQKIPPPGKIGPADLLDHMRRLGEHWP